MNASFAILLSVLLLWTQTARAALCSEGPASSDCQRCACEQPDCCLANAPGNPPSQPATPVPAPTVLKSQWIGGMMTALLSPPGVARSLTPSHFDSPAQFNAVPLHLRHCVFLI